MIEHVFKFKLGRFGVVGIISTLIYFVVAMLGARLTALPPVLVNTLAYAVSSVWSYLGHYHVTFRSDAAHSASIIRFCTMSALGYAVSTAIVYSNHQLGLPAELGTVVVSGFLPVVNFVVMQLWVFASGRSGPAIDPQPAAEKPMP